MNDYQYMTANALTARSHPALLVRKDSPRGGFVSIGIAMQGDRRFARGSAI
jgi:hypothetical protein